MIITSNDIYLAKLFAGKIKKGKNKKSHTPRVINRHQYELDGVPCNIERLVSECEFHLSYEAIRRRIKESGMNGREAISYKTVAEWRKAKKSKA